MSKQDNIFHKPYIVVKQDFFQKHLKQQKISRGHFSTPHPLEQECQTGGPTEGLLRPSTMFFFHKKP